MPELIRTQERGSTKNRALGTTLAKGMVTCCCLQLEAVALGDASSPIHPRTGGFQGRTHTACQAQEILPGAVTTDMESYCLPPWYTLEDPILI